MSQDLKFAKAQEMAEQIFYADCNKLGYYGNQEIKLALEKGEIPARTIENVLMFDVGLGINDYPAIAKGYEGRLCPEAKKILVKEVQECRELAKYLAFVREVGKIQQELELEGTCPETANMILPKKIETILKSKGISVSEGRKRFYQVGEI